MLELPKIKKGVSGTLSGAEKVKGVVAGVALAMGVLAGLPADEVHATIAPSTVSSIQKPEDGAMLLRPGGVSETLFAARHSHKSHHSHRSHHSHYSSRR